MFDESLDGQHELLGSRIHLKAPLVGIGAPAQAFLPRVAELLEAELVLPEHYAVANAVGTVVGNIMLRQEGDVFPAMAGSGVVGYYARVASHQKYFPHFAEALDYARQTLLDDLARQAREAGAQDALLECSVQPVWDGMAHLQAWAASKPATDRIEL